MPELDLMARYPKSSRQHLLYEREEANEDDRKLARRFDWHYFDGPRRLGMGGYKYNSKYFKPVVDDIIKHYGLINDDSVLDVGCAKGFMLHDFKLALPKLCVAGIDISHYCIRNSMLSVAPFIKFASCDAIPYPDKSFDLVIAIGSIHNLDLNGVKASLREIMRVSRKNAYIKVNGYRTDDERIALFRWNLVAQTILAVEEWKQLFIEVGYTGDYSFFTP